MLNIYTYPEYAYTPLPELCSGDSGGSGDSGKRHPVVIGGAGPVGLTAALECARLGIPSVVLDDNNTVSTGSRAVC